MRAAERDLVRAQRSAEWEAYLAALATYTPIPAVRHDVPEQRLILWTFEGRAVLVEPPEVAAVFGPWAWPWYAARRDANLLQRCPICGAAATVTDMSTPEMRGQMKHEPRCPVADETARRLRDTPMPPATVPPSDELQRRIDWLASNRGVVTGLARPATADGVSDLEPELDAANEADDLGLDR